VRQAAPVRQGDAAGGNERALQEGAAADVFLTGVRDHHGASPGGEIDRLSLNG
jgi:hypothetical protein